MGQALDLKEFARIAEAADVGIPDEDLAIMYQGYLGLRDMLKTLPEDPGYFEEPATVFIPHKANRT